MDKKLPVTVLSGFLGVENNITESRLTQQTGFKGYSNYE